MASSSRTLQDNSPELSMVLEKALVLLSPVEFGSLGVLLDEYRVRSTIGVDGFTAGVADIISHGEKVGGGSFLATGFRGP